LDLLQGLHGDGFQYVITEGHDLRLSNVASMAATKTLRDAKQKSTTTSEAWRQTCRHESVQVPHHMLFRRQDSIIHIVVLYERPGKFLWHAAVEPGNPSQKWTSLIGDRKIQFGKYEGVYDNMEIVPTKLDGVKLNIPKDPAAFLQQIPEARFQECNYEQARAFYTAYGSDLTARDVGFIRRAKSLLSKSKAVLDRIGVRFWIGGGTLLGWFRQCGIIPYTKDVDIGIWIKDYKDTLIPAFQAAGLSLRHKFGKMEDSFQLAFRSENVKLDIFFFYEEGDTMWYGSTHGRTREKFKYIFPRFTLCWTELLDMKVRVPCQTLAYIHADVGTNWFEPVKDTPMKLLPLRPRRSTSPPPRSASPPQKICFAPVVPLRPRRNSALPPSFCLAPNGGTAHSRHENRLQNNNKGCAAKFKVAHAPANILDHLSAKMGFKKKSRLHVGKKGLKYYQKERVPLQEVSQTLGACANSPIQKKRKLHTPVSSPYKKHPLTPSKRHSHKKHPLTPSPCHSKRRKSLCFSPGQQSNRTPPPQFDLQDDDEWEDEDISVRVRGFPLRMTASTPVYPSQSVDVIPTTTSVPGQPWKPPTKLDVVVIKNHAFDSADRSKVNTKKRKTLSSKFNAPLKGQIGVRQYHRTDMSKILPHSRIGL
ncbi:hypothetical protein Bbelb_388930, partial [Branchiostoma belcheri]